MQFKFQSALIAGGSRGIGRQIGVKLAQEGVKKIAIHYRTGRSDSDLWTDTSGISGRAERMG